tara:strand:- start:1700 stop:2380 length:681 start_codon:yes stop_codon:yes gene_type:complete
MPINGSGRFIGPGQPLRDGLIGWYDSRYKESSLSSGGTWIDLSGEQNEMAANSSPAWSYGYYFEMDGSDDYFRNSSMGVHTSYTLEFWGDLDASGYQTAFYFDARDAGSTSSFWWLTQYLSQDNNFNSRAVTNWSDGYLNWHHTAIVDNNSGTTLYINGESVATGTSATWGSSELTIGGRYTGDSAPWNGKIGCVRIYDRALSATEIRHNFMCDAGKFDITIEGTS